MEYKWVWVFVGSERIVSALFSSMGDAEKWISENRLTGLLTKMPCDIPVYNWAKENTSFKNNSDYECTPEYIANFGTSYLEHYHYENGKYG